MAKIFFKNSRGDKLCGILSNPTSNKKKPIIILCHGFSTSKDSDTCVTIEKILNKKGISTFRFDFYGHGESGGKFEDITTSEAVNDVLNAIKFLESEGYHKIGLFGSSFGGLASMVVASKSKDLFVLALKSPVSNFKERDLTILSKKELAKWKNKGYRYYISGKRTKLKLNYAFFEDYDNNNGYEAAKKIKIPTIIVHGDKDESVPIEQSKKTSKIIENCRLEILKGANHKYTNHAHFKKMLNLLSNFIIERIYKIKMYSSIQ